MPRFEAAAGHVDWHLTATPSAGLKPTPGLRDQAALPLLAFGRGPDADLASWVRLTRQARCADSSFGADQWFPISTSAESARLEGADAIAVCRACPVSRLCLVLSITHWDIGQHGIWGGLVAADRAASRRQMLAPGPAANSPGVSDRPIAKEFTDSYYDPMIPYTLVLKPGLVIYSIYNGSWFWGRPSFEDLRRDLREVTREIRPDWDLTAPGLRANWEAGDHSMHPLYRADHSRSPSAADMRGAAAISGGA